MKIQKQFALALLLLIVLVPITRGQEPSKLPPPNPVTFGIVGPLVSLPGDLCVFRAEIPEGSKASWAVVPAKAVENSYIDSSGVAVAFASRDEGVFYIVMATTIDSKVVVFTHELENKKSGPEPDPKPDPKPDPDPTPIPGKRYVLAILEKKEPNPTQAKILTGMKEYLKSKSHGWNIEDKDLKDPDGKPSAWLGVYLDKMEASKVDVPAVIIGSYGADGETVTILNVSPLPESPEKAIEWVKKYGG
jgi:hypothetical protein